MKALSVSAIVLVLLMSACGDDDDDGDTGVTPTTREATVEPTDDEVVSPTPTRNSTATPDPGPAPGEDPQGDQMLYLALGDSLSEGIAASDPKRTAWVPLVARELEPEYELLNLGVAGHDSEELIEEGPLDTALAEIEERENDGTPGNEVGIITLEIGGNDLLDLYFDLVIPGTCPSVVESLQIPSCVQALEEALAGYRPNLVHTIETLQSAAPGVPIYLMTLYNPFSGGASTLDEFGVLTLEGQEGTPFPEGLNDIVRAEAAAHSGVLLVEWYELFIGKQREYISQDLIHPNDTGYRVMAAQVLARLELE